MVNLSIRNDKSFNLADVKEQVCGSVKISHLKRDRYPICDRERDAKTIRAA